PPPPPPPPPPTPRPPGRARRTQRGASPGPGGNLTLTGSSKVSALTLNGSSANGTGNVDLNGYNKLIVETSGGTGKTSVLAAVRSEVSYSGYLATTSTTGYILNNAPPQTYYGIAVVDNDDGSGGTRFSTFGGIAVDANSVLVAPEILGDANLDGKVDLTDMSTVLNNTGVMTADWWMGNFDGAATVDLTDLSYVLNNFGVTPNPHPNFAFGWGGQEGGTIEGMRELVASFGGVMTAEDLAEARAYAETIPGYPGGNVAGGARFAMVAAPEPGALAMLGMGMGLVVCRRRRCEL
ncbi:MAG: PEP-CTERM sorting domain-containing protein, partial [Phycisphaerae bacterium]